jgi:hypothetical protein
MEEQVRLILIQASLDPPEAAPARALPEWVNALYGQDKPTGVVADLLAERADAGRSEADR